MARELKIWGGETIYSDVRDRNDRSAQLRTLVVAYTKKEALRLLAVTRHEFDNTFAETGNAAEVKLMNHGPGVWRHVEKDQWRKVYRDGYELVARNG